MLPVNIRIEPSKMSDLGRFRSYQHDILLPTAPHPGFFPCPNKLAIFISSFFYSSRGQVFLIPKSFICSTHFFTNIQFKRWFNNLFSGKFKSKIDSNIIGETWGWFGDHLAATWELNEKSLGDILGTTWKLLRVNFGATGGSLRHVLGTTCM